MRHIRRLGSDKLPEVPPGSCRGFQGPISLLVARPDIRFRLNRTGCCLGQMLARGLTPNVHFQLICYFSARWKGWGQETCLYFRPVPYITPTGARQHPFKTHVVDFSRRSCNVPFRPFCAHLMPRSMRDCVDDLGHVGGPCVLLAAGWRVFEGRLTSVSGLVKNMYPKWNPGKWKHRLKPAVPGG